MKIYFQRGGSPNEVIDQIREYLKQEKGDRFILSLDPDVDKRSTKQNSFFHGVLVPAFAKTLGYRDKETVKALLKNKFLLGVTGDGYPFVKDTSKLNVKEMGEFIDSCMELAAEYGVSLDTGEMNQYLNTLEPLHEHNTSMPSVF